MKLLHHKLLVATLLLMVIPMSMHCSESRRPNRPTRSQYNYSTREQIKEVVENILSQAGINPHQLSGTLYNQYKKSVDVATNSINKLIKQVESLVFQADLTYEINRAIAKRLQEYKLQKIDIPHSLRRAFKAKYTSIKKRTKRMMRYNDNEYITRQDIRNVVKSELDYTFIKQIKNYTGTSNVASNIFDTISDAWTNFVGNTSTTHTNVTHHHPNHTTATTSTAMNVFYSPTCPICQANFYGEERVGALNCGHVFHPECVKQWLKQSKTCPVCRQHDAYLAKIYDSNLTVPGYYSTATTTHPHASSSSSTPAKIYYSDQCPVCLSNFYGTERVGVLNCGHVFHPECIKQWLKQSKSCPLCRQQNAFLAKIYDSKEHVPGYQTTVAPANNIPYIPPVINEPATHTNNQKVYHDRECAICLSGYAGKRVGILSCGHTFHPDCVKKWFNQSKTCPTCNASGVILAKIYNNESDVKRK